MPRVGQQIVHHCKQANSARLANDAQRQVGATGKYSFCADTHAFCLTCTPILRLVCWRRLHALPTDGYSIPRRISLCSSGRGSRTCLPIARTEYAQAKQMREQTRIVMPCVTAPRKGVRNGSPSCARMAAAVIEREKIKPWGQRCTRDALRRPH